VISEVKWSEGYRGWGKISNNAVKWRV
jgi:hypothetical protein